MFVVHILCVRKRKLHILSNSLQLGSLSKLLVFPVVSLSRVGPPVDRLNGHPAVLVRFLVFFTILQLID
jgi:hypothetical protein